VAVETIDSKHMGFRQPMDYKLTPTTQGGFRLVGVIELAGGVSIRGLAARPVSPSDGTGTRIG
jgi:hypothetical protein